MNVFILCFFALVPFHNASVHEAKLTVCPDFAEALRFANELESYQFTDQPANSEMESVLKPTPAAETDSTQILSQETGHAPIPLDQLEPEIVPENPIELKQAVVESEAHAEPAPLEIPERLTPKPLSPSRNVEFAAAAEPLSEVQPAPAEVKVQETAPTDAPIRRPWGVLTFSIFLLLLSVSANVFLGWQLIEARTAKLKA